MEVDTSMDGEYGGTVVDVVDAWIGCCIACVVLDVLLHVTSGDW